MTTREELLTTVDKALKECLCVSDTQPSLYEGSSYYTMAEKIVSALMKSEKKQEPIKVNFDDFHTADCMREYVQNSASYRAQEFVYETADSIREAAQLGASCFCTECPSEELSEWFRETFVQTLWNLGYTTTFQGSTCEIRWDKEKLCVTKKR